jgi:hypothetical protein
MLELKTDRPDCADYEQDTVLWLERQIALLRQRRFAELDLDNLIEELESIVKRERRKLESRLEVLLMHLLKCQFQHDHISSSWRGTLFEQRNKIKRMLRDSPSLAPGLEHVAAEVYPDAVQLAAIETGLALTVFPPTNPYTLEQMRDFSFVPAGPDSAAQPPP